MLIGIKQSTGSGFVARLFLLYMPFLVCCPEISGQHQKTLALIDYYYYAGQLEKSKRLTDSIEPIIRDEAGDTSLYYGEFIASYPSMVYEKTGDFKRAAYFYKKGMAIIQNAAGEITPSIAEACVNLGNMYNLLGLNGSALSYVEKGRNILFALQLTNSEPFAAGTNTLANIYAALGNYNKARSLYDSTLQLIDSLSKTNPKIATQRFTIYNNMGTMYEKTGDYEKYKYYLEKALLAGKKFPGKSSIEYNTIMNNYGMALSRMGHFESAIVTLQEVNNNIRSGKNAANRLLFFVKNNIVNVLKQLNKVDSACLLSEKLIAEPGFSIKSDLLVYYGLLQNHVTTLMSAGNWLKADSIGSSLYTDIRNEFDFSDAMLTIKIQLTLCELYLHTEKYALAVSMTDSTRLLVESLILKNYELFPEQEKLAIISYIHQLNTLQAAAFYRYEFKNRKYAKEWFTFHNQYKNFLLKKQQSINSRLRTTNEETIKADYHAWKNNRQFLSEQYKLAPAKRSNITDSIAMITDKIEEELNKASIMPSSTYRTISPETVASHLKKGECLVQFVRFLSADLYKTSYTAHYSAFLVHNETTDPEWVYLCRENELTSLLQNASSNLMEREVLSRIFIDPRLRITGKKYPGDKLYALLWKPIGQRLSGVKKIYCINDGLLLQIPVGALPVTNNTFLADKFIFSYKSGIDAIISPAKQIKSHPRMAVWGGIEYNVKNNHRNNETKKTNPYWPYLKWTAAEVKQIQSISTSFAQVQFFDKWDATEENFRNTINKPGFEIIHIATHGYFSSTLPMFATKQPFNNSSNPVLRSENPLLHCGLVMAGANQFYNDTSKNTYADGLLNGFEISDLSLENTQLVVLSACETGLGNTMKTESVFGLQRAFKLAGAERIVMSLWKVPDKQTAELMVAFYTNLSKGLSIENAFEVAQKGIRKRYPSPYFWAGFVLIE